MARSKKTFKMNPSDMRDINSDIDAGVTNSGSVLDALYDELAELELEEAAWANAAESASTPAIARKARTKSKELARRVKETQGKIAKLVSSSLRDAKRRVAIVAKSHTSRRDQAEIRDVRKLIFAAERKANRGDLSVRPEMSRMWAAVITLEEKADPVLIASTKKPRGRRAGEARDPYAQLAKEWKRVYAKAKDDTRKASQDSIEWVQAQMVSIDKKRQRGESASVEANRVATRIRKIEERADAWFAEKRGGYARARRGLEAWTSKIADYAATGQVTRSGVDGLKRELEEFAGQYRPVDRASWGPGESREFASQIRKLRKALDAIRPKGTRRKNPCVGFHFHGKDADDLLKALEASADRQGLASPKRKGNPGKKKKVAKKKVTKKKSSKKTTKRKVSRK